MPTINDAIILAAHIHDGQVDREGLPYILHVLTVMMQQTTDEHRIAAVLHDAVEDSDTSIEDLRDKGYSERVLAMVEAMTHTAGEPWEDYIDRIIANSDAIPIKLADLTHNTDIRRMQAIKDSDMDRFRRYIYAWQKLTAAHQKAE